ncbi:MAG: hypothetical protein AAF801_14210 [Pseudomonadota bacterium]
MPAIRNLVLWCTLLWSNLALLSSQAIAQEELIFNVFIPRPAPLYKDGLEPWARAVEEASNGELRILIPTASLAPPPKQYDIVLDGVADISVAPIAFQRKTLGLDLVAGIPQIASTARGASVAAWQTHEAFLAETGQWEDLVPLTIFTLGAPAILSNADPVQSADDLQGFKVLAVGKDKIDTWINLGGTPVGGTGQRPFEMVSSGVVDGLTNPLGTAVTQGLLETTNSVTLVPGGMGGRAVFALFINRERFEGLSPEGQAALISMSGATLAADLGGIMDRIDASGQKQFEEAGIALNSASPAFIAEIAAAGAHIEAAWKSLAEENGIDAAAALAHFRRIAGEDEALARD